MVNYATLFNRTIKRKKACSETIVLGEQDIGHRSCLKNFQPTTLYCQDKCSLAW